jgi:hypothetical protein
VDVDDRTPFLQAHVEEEAVAQDAGIVDHPVDAPEGVERALNDTAGTVPIGDAVGTGGGFAAKRPDLVDHLLCWPGVATFARHRCADIVDHHARAVCRHRQCEVAANSAAGARDHDHLAFQHSARHHSPLVGSLAYRSIPVGPGRRERGASGATAHACRGRGQNPVRTAPRVQGREQPYPQESVPR